MDAPLQFPKWQVVGLLALCLPVLGLRTLRGQEIAVLRGHNGAVMMAAFGQDSKRVVTAGTDLQARLWDVRSGTTIQTFAQHTGPLYTLAVSGDGQTLVTGSQDNTVRLWDLPLHLPVRRLQEAGPALSDLTLTTDGQSLIGTSADFAVRLFLLPGGAASPSVSRQGHQAVVLSSAMRGDGAMFATADASGKILFWTPDIETSVASVSGHAGAVSRLFFPAGNQQLLSAGDDGLLRQWQLPAATTKTLLTSSIAITAMSINPGQNNMLVVPTGQPCRLIGLQTGEILRDFPAAGQDITGLAVSSDNSWAACPSSTGEIRILNPGDGSIIGRLAGHTGAVTDVAVHADNQRLATAGEDGTVRLWKLPIAAKPMLGHSAALKGLVAASRGQWIVTFADDLTLRVWNSSGAVTQQFTGHGNPITAAAIRHDDEQVASGDAQGNVRLWNPAEAAVEGLVAAHAGAIRSLVYSPDGTRLLTAGADGIVRAWTLPLPIQAPVSENDAPKPVWEFRSPDNEALVQLEPVSAELGCLAVSASGSRLFRIQWDGVLAGTIDSPGGAIRTVDATPSGNAILGTTDSGIVHLFGADLTLVHSLPAIEGLVSARWDRTGTWIAVCDQQPRVRVLDGKTGRPAEEIRAAMPLMQADWTTPDQSSIAAIGNASEGILLQRSLQQIQDGLPPGAVSIAMSADRQTLFAGGADGLVRQWSLMTGQTVRTMAAGSPIADLTLAGNGQILAVLCEDGLFRCCKPDFTLLSTSAFPARSNRITLNSDGSRAATAGLDGIARVWDTSTGILLQSFTDHSAGTAIHAICFLPDNKTLVTSGDDRTIRMAATSVLKALPLTTAKLHDVVSVAGGASLLHASDAGIVELITVASGKSERRYATMNQQILAVASRPDSQRFAGGCETGDVLIWNANSGDKILQSLSVESAVTTMQWSADNQRLAVATAANAVFIYGPSLPGIQPAAELVFWQKMQCDSAIRRIQFSADGRRLFIALADGRLEEWVCSGPGQRRQYQHGGPVYGVAVTKDGSVAVSCSVDQTLRVWDNLTGQQKFQLSGHRGPVHSVAISPDETFAVSAGSDGTLRLWDIVGGRQLKQLATWDQTMYSVAIHPQGGQVAAAGADRKIHVLDMTTGTEIRTVTGHTDYIHSVTYSPDGTRILSFGYAGQMKVWNAGDGQLIYAGKVGQIGNSARYSPDGSFIVVGSGDGTASVMAAP